MNVNPFSYLIEKLKSKVSKTGDTMTGKLTIDTQNGTTSAEGYSYVTLGNDKATGTDKNSTGMLELFGDTGNRVRLYALSPTATRYIGLPDKNGTLSLTSDLPKTYSKEIRLAGATWSQSASGMYYISSANAYAVPGATEILSLTIEGWDSLRATDNIIPYISGGTKISLMSNVNTFASVDYSMVKIKALYR